MKKTLAARSLACLLTLLLVCCTLVIAPAAAGTNPEYDIAFTKKAPVIDGEISANEYGRMSIVSWALDDGDADGFLVGKDLYKVTDDPDLAISFYAAWTNDDLYLAWKVTTKYDSRLPQDKTDNYMYENCCVQFILTPGVPDNTVKKYQTSDWSGDYLEIGICLRDDGESYKCCWSQPVAANNGLALSDWEAISTREGDTTVYECRIPWGKSGIESKGDGAQFGLTFGIGVQDDYNETPGMIEWQDAILGGKNADNCAIMTLSGSGQGQQGVDIDVANKEDAPNGDLPDGLAEGLLTIDLFDTGITEGKSSLIFDPTTVSQYNAKYSIALLLRPDDASNIDGYYTVMESIKGSGTDPVFNDIQKGDVCLLVHADQTSSETATARYNAAAEVAVGQKCYLHGFQKDSSGKIGWKYKNAQLVPITDPSAALCQTWVDMLSGEVIVFEADGAGGKFSELNASAGETFEWALSDDGALTIDGKATTWSIEGNKLTLDGKQYTKYVETDTSALEAAVDKAAGLKEEDYTAASWAKLQEAVEAALDVDLFDQDAIDKAAKSIESAIKALVSANADTSSEAPSAAESVAPTSSDASAEDGGLSTTMIVIIVIVCVVVVAGIVVAVIVMRKKKA